MAIGGALGGEEEVGLQVVLGTSPTRSEWSDRWMNTLSFPLPGMVWSLERGWGLKSESGQAKAAGFPSPVPHPTPVNNPKMTPGAEVRGLLG